MLKTTTLQPPEGLAADTRPWFSSISHVAPWLPAWVISALFIVAAIALSQAAHRLATRFALHLVKRRSPFWRSLIGRTRTPTRLAFALGATAIVAPLTPLTPGEAALVGRALLVAFILLLGSIVLAGLDVGAALYMRRFRLDESDNLLARKHLTQVKLLKRTASVLVMLVTAALALMTLPAVRQWGVSLLAAGGAAGIIVGLALQPLLSNLISGIQIATTQPIRLDDQVVVEGEFGTVEEISATYVVVRVWDERRMVLPLTYFMQKPFQNWTRNSAQLIGAVMLYLDYRTPIGRLREQLEQVLHGSSRWDGRLHSVQVTDASENTLQVRFLVSAADASALFDLRCEVREKLAAYVAEHFPDALPRTRLQMDDRPADAAGSMPAGAALTEGNAARGKRLLAEP